MLEVTTWILVGAAGVLGLFAVALEEPARAGACLIGAIVSAAGLCFLSGAGDLSVVIVMAAGAGAALLLLMGGLVLNLTREERGGRKLRIAPTFHLVVLGWVCWAVARSSGPLPAQAAPAPGSLASGASFGPLFDGAAPAVALAGVIMLATVIGTIVVVRRRS